MVNRYFIIHILALFFIAPLLSNAQTIVNINLKGEKTVQIGGNSFVVALNDADKTAELVDREYKVDDSKYPVSKSRSFKSIGKVGNVRTLVIPESVVIGKTEYTVTTLGRAVFAGYTNIDHVQIPPTVKKIEDYAFFSTSLAQVEVPSSVEYMGQRVFGQCKKLKAITLPNASMAASGLFSESKDIDVRLAEYNVATSGRAKPRQEERQEVVFASSSDVDVNIPSSKKTNEDVFVVIIANENYDKEVRVNCAYNDGRTFKKYCENVLGIPTTNIHYVEDATLGNMMEEVNWVAKIAGVYEGDARIIFYYAGHGIPNESDGAAYLLPVDVAGNNIAGAYSLKNLYQSLGGLNVKNVVLFLDACFSGAVRGDGMLASARGIAIKSKAEAPRGNMIVFSASQDDETAYPYAEKGHGMFTYYLLKKLQETSGDCTMSELGDYISKQVARRSIVVNGKTQTPSITSSMGGNWKNLKLK